ncbi:hypothetical protein RB596_000173 [Gaeumannomyces avenae]
MPRPPSREKKLRSRKKGPSAVSEDLTEAQKWRNVYRILFPDVREDEIPSPYSNLSEGELEGYKDDLQREFPPLVRHYIEQKFEREFNFVEEGLKRRAIEIFHQSYLKLFQSYRKLEGAEAF